MGDLTGKYTCHQYNGSNVIDYRLAGTNMKKINFFKVLPLTQFSDHCQIIANLDIKPTNIYEKINYFKVVSLTPFSGHCQIIANLDIKATNIVSDETKYSRAQGKFKWNKKSNSTLMVDI